VAARDGDGKCGLGQSGTTSLAGFEKKVKTVLLSFQQKKTRKESCCCYHAKEIAKNNSSVGLWRKKTQVLLKSKLEEKQIKPYTLERSNHGCHDKNWTT
jgi:predicted alternative tryptophan synthase beta-subunit